MASDMPYSANSKWLDSDGVEHLVSVRGTTIDQFKANLEATATAFPGGNFTAQTPTPVTHEKLHHQDADPQAPVSIAQARRQTEVEQVQRAHANVREQREATGHVCPEHGVAKASRFNGGSYCPTKLEDGGYCKWVWPPTQNKATGS